ncbi:MAG TPA: DUF4197 domain-containing protein [Rhodocyclaceae bacterium]|nr:DUF4197 domain-containing protein [Rhodocyclaceae bacterium]
MSCTLRLISTLAILTLTPCAQATGLADISSADASSGLKEALVAGADYAVSSLGQDNGFLGNDKVKIPLPGNLQKAEKALRALGMGKQADELVETMNHAAEKAVAEAKPILLDAVKKMTVKDAKDILTGGDDSVTEFFKRSSSETLGQKFKPIVKSATQKVQLAERYNKFAGKAASFGLLDKQDADLESYVTKKAMDGLFLMIAEKERSIRQNPVGAGSGMLQKVFGALGR